MIIQEIKLLQQRTNNKELRKFGITFAILFGLITVFLYSNNASSMTTTGIVAAVFLILGLKLPRSLKYIYLGWMSFAVVMGFFMTKVILTLLFIIAFVPSGIITRLIRNDHLDQKIDKNAASYWKKRDRKPYKPEMTEVQF